MCNEVIHFEILKKSKKCYIFSIERLKLLNTRVKYMKLVGYT